MSYAAQWLKAASSKFYGMPPLAASDNSEVARHAEAAKPTRELLMRSPHAVEHMNPKESSQKTVLNGDSRAGEIVVPLFTEELSVSKRVVPKYRVRVSRVTRKREQLVDELLDREYVEIDRLQLDKPIDAMPAVREEDGVIIVPVVEEVLTIERRLILKEEIRIRKIRDKERRHERVLTRYQEASVTRVPVEESTAARRAGFGLIGQMEEKR